MLGIRCDGRNFAQRTGARSQSGDRDCAIGRRGKKERRNARARSNAYESVWVSPCQIDPFGVPVDENLQYLISVDSKLLETKGITLAESSFVCSHKRQYFASSIGSRIDQTRTTTGAGFTAFSFKDDEIQKRSYPNSFGGPVSVKGIRACSRTRPAGQCAPYRGGSRSAPLRRLLSRGCVQSHPRWKPIRLADS